MVEHSRSQQGFGIRTVLIILLLGLAWRILSLGMADATSLSKPEQALQWKSNHPAALFQLAEEQVTNPGLSDAAKRNALAALQSYPLEGRAYRVLGLLAQAEKQPARAYELFQNAIGYSPRDIESRLWLLNHALASENVDAAVLHLDRMLRIRIDLLPQLVPTIAGLAAHPRSQEVLIHYLEKKPAWREQAINSMASHKDAGQKYAVFFNRLAKSSGGLSDAEQQAWLNALNQSQQWSLAYLSWATQLSDEQQLGLGNLFNGSFEHEPLGSEFDWQFNHVPGAVIDRVFREGAIGQAALRVSFDDRQVLFSHVKQTLVLPAGRYRLSGRYFADDLRTELGLVWSVQCLGQGNRQYVTDPMKGRSPDWQSFSLDFEVPGAGCPAQSLILMLPARVASEQQIGGSIWFDALRVQKIQ